MRTMTLSTGEVALLDDDDYERFAAFRWTRSKSKRTSYAIRSGGGGDSTVYLHREVAGAVQGQEVDHVNGNGLDCQRRNLRLATRSTNMANTRLYRSNTSGFKGVTRTRSGRWMAQVMVDYRHICLGTFDDPTVAARAHDAGAVRYFGSFARTNVDLGLLEPSHA